MNNTYATFTDPIQAEKAAGALLDHGIKSQHISIVFPEGYGKVPSHDLEDADHLERGAKNGITTTTLADAEAGSAKGAGFGLAAGTLVALASIFVPGFGLVIGGGALAIAIGGIAGSTVAGAIAGGITGFLKDQGVPEDQIVSYHTILGNGGAMITVSPILEPLDNATIESILAKYGGSVASYPVEAAVMVSEGSPVAAR